MNGILNLSIGMQIDTRSQKTMSGIFRKNSMQTAA